MIIKAQHLLDVSRHNDVANNIYLLEQNILKDFNFTDLSANAKWVNAVNYHSHTDLTRLKAGKVRGQVSSDII